MKSETSTPTPSPKKHKPRLPDPRRESFHDRMKEDPRFLVLLAAATTAVYTGAFDDPETHDTEDDEHWTAEWLAFRAFICAEAVYETLLPEEDVIEKFNASFSNPNPEAEVDRFNSNVIGEAAE